MRYAHVGAAVLSMVAVLASQNLSAHAHGFDHGYDHDAHGGDHYVNVQPIEICDNVGERCAGTPIFATETKAIWQKAGVDINFLPIRQLNESLFLISTGTAIDYGLFSGAPRTGVSSDPKAINVWFAQDLFYPGGIRFGRGNIGGNKLVLNSSAISSFNGGKGRIDTLAHELGHNLGLFHHHHESHLLAAGDQRQSPESLLDITTNQTSLFSQQEISTVFASPFVQDTPQILVEGESDPLNPQYLWTVKFLSGSATSLTRLTLDLSSVGEALKSAGATLGTKQSFFELGNTAGISEDAIAISEENNGSSKLVVDLTKGDFNVGDSFDFGINSVLFPELENLGFDPDDLTGSLLTFEFSDGYRTSSKLREGVVKETTTSESASAVPPVAVAPLLPELANELAVVPISPDHGHSHGSKPDHDHGHSHENQLVIIAEHDHGLEQTVVPGTAPEVNLVPESSPDVIIEPQPPVTVEPQPGTEPDRENNPVPNVSIEAETEPKGSPILETVVEPPLVAAIDVNPEFIALPTSKVAIDVGPIIPSMSEVEREPNSVVNYFTSVVESNDPSPVSLPEPSGGLGIAFGGLSLMRIRLRGRVGK